jgi:hypothetical protein
MTVAPLRPGLRAAALIAVPVIAALALIVTAQSAMAASYRYWGYYSWTNGNWAFETKGPDATKPADGAVEGWRFAVTAESGSPRVPRADGDFAAICAQTKPAAGKKRVAVVLDPGVPADAPSGAQPQAPHGECALVDVSASGAQVLAAVTPARVEKGLVCGIAGYPATGCGDQVDQQPPATPDATVALALPKARPAAGNATAKAAKDAGDGGPPWTGIAIGVAVVAALGTAAVVRARGGARP